MEPVKKSSKSWIWGILAIIVIIIVIAAISMSKGSKSDDQVTQTPATTTQTPTTTPTPSVDDQLNQAGSNVSGLNQDSAAINSGLSQ